MNQFQIGDEVELAVDVQKFKRESEESGCDTKYIKHFCNGHSAVVSGFHYAHTTHMTFKVDGLEESNFFYYDSFRLVDSEISKIKQESQRL